MTRSEPASWVTLDTKFRMNGEVEYERNGDVPNSRVNLWRRIFAPTADQTWRVVVDTSDLVVMVTTERIDTFVGVCIAVPKK